MGNHEKMVVVPDDFSTQDQIGYMEHGAGLVEMIRAVQAKGSFTIGVFGQWGQGKTSMLRQIEVDLKNVRAHDGTEILTLWFNPWQFSGEEHMIIPFFHTLASYLQEYTDTKKKEAEAAKPISTKIKNFLKVLSQVPVALAYGTEFKIKAPLIVESKFKFSDAIKRAQKKNKRIMQNEVEKYESMYYRLISVLQDAARDLGLKIVVFIDDLDRCLPEKAVELLEGVKVFLDLPGFVYVMGVAREVIEKGIRFRYRDLYKEENEKPFLEQDYLDKIIQFPMTLPPPDPELLKEMVKTHMKGLDRVTPYLDTIQRALEDNPRSLKRFVNNLSFTFWVADKKAENRSIEFEFEVELLIKMTLIVFKFPTFYKLIGRNPDHLIKVQKLFKEEKQKKNVLEKIADADKTTLPPPKQTQMATGLPVIDDLKLFQYPNLESITEILGIQKREGDAKDDVGFKDEEEVRKYVSLLSATSTGGEKTEPTGPSDTGGLWKTMESRMMPLEGGPIVLRDEDKGNELSTRVPPFLLDKYPVTQDLFEKVLGKDKNRSRFHGGDRPAENVSWFDAVNFCNHLSKELGLNPVYTIDGEKVEADFNATGFRLPTEAEWEWACRGGQDGDCDGKTDKVAWHKLNSKGASQGVGKKEPNCLGLYDMLGNVWEWCWDRHGYYPSGKKDVWYGPDEGPDRVFRGGSWNTSTTSCRPGYRLSVNPSFHDHDLGFRLARSL